MAKDNQQEENPFFKIFQKAEELTQEQERNTARNAQISQEISDLMKRVEEIPNDIKGTQNDSIKLIQKAGNHIATSIQKAGNETVQNIENASKNVKGIELGLNEDDKKSIQSIKDDFSLFKTLKYFVGAMLLVSALALLGSGYLAKKWYDTSIKTKQEVRTDLLHEITSKGDVITSEAYLTALQHEKDMLKGWVSANPEDSKSYKTHRKAIMNIEGNKDAIFFESPTSNELGKGGKKGLFD